MFSIFRNKYNIIPTKSIILNKNLPFFNSKCSHFLQNVLIFPQKRPKKGGARPPYSPHSLDSRPAISPLCSERTVLFKTKIKTGVTTLKVQKIIAPC